MSLDMKVFLNTKIYLNITMSPNMKISLNIKVPVNIKTFLNIKLCLNVKMKCELFTSNCLLAISCSLLVTSYQSLVRNHQSLVASHQLLVTDDQLLLVTSYLSPLPSEDIIYQLPKRICNIEFIRHKSHFPEHLFLNVFAATSMINFDFWSIHFPQHPLNFQEQLFTTGLHKIVLENFIKFTAKHLYCTLYFDKVASSRPAT